VVKIVCFQWFATPNAANYFEKYDTDGNVDVRFAIHQDTGVLSLSGKRNGGYCCAQLMLRLRDLYDPSKVSSGLSVKLSLDFIHRIFFISVTHAV
jgi:hypothetical protein